MSSPTIGILAVQGAFAEHAVRLRTMGCRVVELRQRADIEDGIEGLVLPGGESTVQAKLLRELGMLDPLRELICVGLPVLGTCAGLILLAARVQRSSDGRESIAKEAPGETFAPGALGTLDVSVVRNGYGRQLGSFHAEAELRDESRLCKGANTKSKALSLPLTFIRAPRIIAVGDSVDVLVSLRNEPVAVCSHHQIGCCFHPELDADDTIYQHFLGFF